MLRMAVGMIAVSAPLQLVIGDQHGLNTLEAPAGESRGHGGALATATSPATSSSSPGPTRRRKRIVSRSPSRARQPDPDPRMWRALIQGLTDFPPEDRPPVANVFFAFRMMVGIGVLLIAVGLSARCSGGAADCSTAAGSCASILCLAARLHRHPRRLDRDRAGPPALDRLRHSCAPPTRISPVPAASIAGTLALFVFVYGIVFATGLYYINRLIVPGPKESKRRRPPACRTGRFPPPRRPPARRSAAAGDGCRPGRSPTGG